MYSSVHETYMPLVLFTSQILKVASCNLMYFTMWRNVKKSAYKLTVSFMAFSGATPNSCGNRPVTWKQRIQGIE